MDKAKIIEQAMEARKNAGKYSSQAKQFLPPQSPREQKLIVTYSVLTVIVTAIINSVGHGSFLGGGSKTVFKVDSVVTYSGWTGWQTNNQNKCNAIDQSSEYDTLMSEGWKITSTQNQSKPVNSGVGLASGECQGTLYVFSR